MKRTPLVTIAGAFEHPTRNAPDRSTVQLHAECAIGAIKDAGLRLDSVDGYFCAGDAPGRGPLSVLEYLNLNPSYVDSTEIGGSSYLAHVGHAAAAIHAGKCKVALITLAGRPRSERMATGTVIRDGGRDVPERQYEVPYRMGVINNYALCAMRHMHDFGTTSEQLAWVKVAASWHAQHNQDALLQKVVTVDDVVNSPLISSPLHRLDCCVITDGGGALVVVHPDMGQELARNSGRPCINVIGAGEAVKHQQGGLIDLTYSAGYWSGARAFEQAGVKPVDIDYVSIYDSFTISVVIALEDLGFCPKGQGGKFVSDGNLISGSGKLPFNTDGGGLCNNHPANRGGITKVIEAVRQLRGEAHAAVQVKNCDLALAHGTGGSMGSRHGSATLILERS